MSSVGTQSRKGPSISGLLVLAILALPSLAQEDAPSPRPGDFPDAPGNIATPTFDPPRIGKRPGLYSAEDWREVIDSTWGQGDPTVTKLAVFDRFWKSIDEKFACFQDLDVDWRALRDRYRPEISSGVSRGRFAAIMNHLALALQESHTGVFDPLVNFNTALRPGVPIMRSGIWGNNSHFGACLTPMLDGSLLVYKVGSAHPLGLQPGDLVLGYEGLAWKDLYPALLQAELPFTGLVGSSPSSREHSLLIGAGLNWHLFDTIDVLKHDTGEIQHFPTAVLDRTLPFISCTEQMDLPGIPKPPGTSEGVVTWGVIEGTQIGYIYVYGWAFNAEEEFYRAIRALTVDRETVGLIIDFRYNFGGNMFLSTLGLSLLFKERTPTIAFAVRGDPMDHLVMVNGPSENYVINNLPDPYFYDRPIAVLTGPGAVSSGDQVALRMTFHPRARTFGKGTAAAFNSPTALNLGSGWIAAYAEGDAFKLTDPLHYLTHDELPVDYPVWLDEADVVQGRDTVVETAIRWIRNRPPRAVIHADRQSECTSPEGAVVRLDGSVSTDPDSTAGTHDGLTLFEWFEDYGTSSQKSLGSGEVLEIALPLGPHHVSLKVRDAFGESDLADMALEVIDTTPPSLALTLSPSILWPPNHRIVPVHASVTASDRCGESRVILTSVSSDQPDESLGIGDGNFPHDIQDADSGQPDFDVSLRAERDRGSGGRTYTLVYTARDEVGNALSAPASVRVPRD